MKTIRVAVKEPLRDWKIREVEDALPSYQKIVGGYIEGFYRAGDLCFFCNEEGKFKDLHYNFRFGHDHIFGTVFAVRADEEGEFVSVEDSDLEICREFSDGKE